MRYRVTLLQLVHHETEIDADTPEDAQLKARTIARLNMSDHYTIGYELAGCECGGRCAIIAPSRHSSFPL